MINGGKSMENSTGKSNVNSGGMLGGAYFVTIVGAAIYFIQSAASFWGGVLGVLKAFVWPAFVIYRVLELLNL
jgi:hypothetical protein